MHQNSKLLMEMMFSRWAPEPGAGRLMYDVGSYDVNGSYRDFCEKKGWNYKGIDIVEGPNVDIVVQDEGEISFYNDFLQIPIPYTRYPGTFEKAELVVSGQCLEHTRYPWIWILNVSNLMRETTFLFLIAPASWPEHKHPIDCWRILPDGMRALAEWADLEYIDGGLHPAGRIGDQDCFDCWVVMRKR